MSISVVGFVVELAGRMLEVVGLTVDLGLWGMVVEEAFVALGDLVGIVMGGDTRTGLSHRTTW
jgi:hypothetical protein